MDIENLIKHMREEAQDYRSGRTLGRAFADTEDVLDEAATHLEQFQSEIAGLGGRETLQLSFCKVNVKRVLTISNATPRTNLATAVST